MTTNISPQVQRGAASKRSEGEVRATRSMGLMRDAISMIHQGAAETSSRERDCMSDQQLAIEYRCQARVLKAIAEMNAAIGDVNAGSSVMQISASAFGDFLHDAGIADKNGITDFVFWDEKIAEARR